MTGYSLWQRFKLKLFGRAYLEHRTRVGWSGSLPFYAVVCMEHGVFEDYPHGFPPREYFTCPECYRGSTSTTIKEKSI